MKHARPSTAKQPGRPAYEPMTAAEAEAMLHDAGAPMPWERPDLLDNLAGIVDTVAALRGGIEVSPEVKLRWEAQAAIIKLRRLLPQLGAWSTYHQDNPSLLTTPRTPEEWAAHRHRYEAQLAAELRMLAALSDVHHPIKPSLLPLDPANRSHWHFSAGGLWVAYRNTVGSGSTSQHGPAVRFVALALDRAGYGHRSPESIEKALNRSPVTTNSA